MVKILLSAVGLAIAGGVFFLYTQPTYDTVQALSAEIEQYNQALDKAAQLQQLKQTLLSRYNSFNPADLDRLQKSLPDHVDNVRLVLDLDSLAGAHGMALQNVVINNPVSESGNATVIGAIGIGQQKFDSLTLQFSTHGSYPDFVAFLNDLEDSLRIVDLVSLSLQRDPTPAGQAAGSGLSYRYDIAIRTYWLK